MPRKIIDGKEKLTVGDVTVAGSLVFGGDSNGDWRIKKSGDALAQERKEDGTWQEKSSAQP